MPANYELWKPWEDEFVTEVYPLREWSINGIALKLEREPQAIIHRARKLGIRRPRGLDYDAIARLARDGQELKAIAAKLGYSSQAVRYALKVIKREAA